MARKGGSARFGNDFLVEQVAKRKKWKKKGVKAGHGGDFDLGFETAAIGGPSDRYTSQVVEHTPDFMVNPKLLNTDGLPEWLKFIVYNDPIVARGVADKEYKADSPFKRRLSQAARTKIMKSIDREHWLQVRICYELERQYPEHMGYWKAVPNGGYRSSSSAGKMQYEGQLRGAQDLDFDIPRGAYHGMKLEVKTEIGSPDKEQLEARDRFTGKGYFCRIEKGFDDCWKVIVAYFSLPEFDNKTTIAL